MAAESACRTPQKARRRLHKKVPSSPEPPIRITASSEKVYVKETCGMFGSVHQTSSGHGRAAVLRPQQNGHRECQSLDGLWEFQVAQGDGRTVGLPLGLTKPRQIAVPASWHEQYIDLFSHFSEGWYQKKFFANRSWNGRRIFLHFGSVCQKAEVWLNSVNLGMHNYPHLPFEFDITDAVSFTEENNLIVLADGTLDVEALPPAAQSEADTRAGWGHDYPAMAYDFFPFSGIHRPVTLYALHKEAHIKDIHVHATYDAEAFSARIQCELELSAPWRGKVRFEVDGHEEVKQGNGATSMVAVLLLDRPRIWDIGQGHLYDLNVTLEVEERATDRYRVRFGIRNIEVRGNDFLLNGKPVHFKGFGRHEDFDIIGRGLCHALIIKDYDLMEWVGANSFRTAHYPYAEEWLDMADERGMLVISESPFVGLSQRLYKPEVLEKATTMLDSHIRRDRNHPCVVMWSLANEPGAPGPEDGDDEKEATPLELRTCLDFYQTLVKTAKALDQSRPLTYAMHMSPSENPMAEFFDVLCVNKYYGWYEWQGRIEDSLDDLLEDLKGFHDEFKKPIILAEFGADAIAGVHHLPEVMFSEEYQAKIVEMQYCKLLAQPWFLGAHVWNFADFRANQSITRTVLNRKGVFTRSRQPKLIAHVLRKLWRNASQTPELDLQIIVQRKDDEIRHLKRKLEEFRKP